VISDEGNDIAGTLLGGMQVDMMLAALHFVELKVGIIM